MELFLHYRTDTPCAVKLDIGHVINDQVVKNSGVSTYT